MNLPKTKHTPPRKMPFPAGAPGSPPEIPWKKPPAASKKHSGRAILAKHKPKVDAPPVGSSFNPVVTSYSPKGMKKKGMC